MCFKPYICTYYCAKFHAFTKGAQLFHEIAGGFDAYNQVCYFWQTSVLYGGHLGFGLWIFICLINQLNLMHVFNWMFHKFLFKYCKRSKMFVIYVENLLFLAAILDFSGHLGLFSLWTNALSMHIINHYKYAYFYLLRAKHKANLWFPIINASYDGHLGFWRPCWNLNSCVPGFF